jgi:hypothetical protein
MADIKNLGLYELLYQFDDVDNDMAEDDLVKQVCDVSNTGEIIEFAHTLIGYLNINSFTIVDGGMQICDTILKEIYKLDRLNREKEAEYYHPLKAKPKIFVTITGKAKSQRFGISCSALAEDGAVLAGHISSTEEFAKHDMGLTSDYHHKEYKIHYPDGFELVWVDDWENHKEFQAAFKKNQKYAEAL